ncbi:MAG: serine hydrolase [Bacteroidia bacterium]
MNKTICLLIIFINSHLIIAQTLSNDEIDRQIKLVENNLSGRVRISEKGYNLEDRMKFYNVKGLSLAVIHDYKIVWAKGYGWADEKEKRPVTIKTLFQAASNSKSLNGMAILKLAQDQKINLYTDINTYLKSWQFPYDSISKNKKITLADLLSHTSGIKVINFPGYSRKEKIPSITQILDGKKPSNTPAVSSEYEPGKKFQYSGIGTTITRLLVSDVTNRAYDEFMYENILHPLGMDSSFFTQPPPKNKLKQLATGYRINGNEVENKFRVYPEQGPDGLWTTPTEMAAFVNEIMLAFAGKSEKILNQEMTKLMLSPYRNESPGLGVFVQQRGKARYFTHGAGNEGFGGQYFGSFTGGNGVVVYVNSDSREIINEVINSVAFIYKWEDFFDTTVRKVIVPADSICKKYVGVYVLDDKLATVFKNGNDYYYKTNNDNLKMYFTSDSSFFNMESLSDKTFKIDSLGKVTGISRMGFGIKYSPLKKLQNPDTLHLKNFEFGSLAWEFFENKKYTECIEYCKRGLELYPNDDGLLSKMAHAYLFNGNYDKAIGVYGTQLKTIWTPNKILEKNMQQSVVYFKESGYDVKIFEKVFKDLKIKLPKGY